MEINITQYRLELFHCFYGQDSKPSTPIPEAEAFVQSHKQFFCAIDTIRTYKRYNVAYIKKQSTIADTKNPTITTDHTHSRLYH